jgi:hypothetical protein
MKRMKTDNGIAMVWLAVTILFITAAAAVAVDASSAFNTARTDQTTADLACLAGVRELPDTNAAIGQTINYTVANWPALAGNTPTIVGTTATYADGAGNSIAIDAQFGGDPSKMHVEVTEQSDSFFGRVIGANTIPVSQEAFCRVTELKVGAGLPFGALPAGFQGGLQAPNPCGTNSGNCGALSIPRDDVGGAGPTLIKNIAEGTDRDLTPWLGPIAGAANCSAVSAGQECSIVSTDTGVSSAHLGEGMLQRLENDPGATCTTVVSGRTINCDTLEQVLGPDPLTKLMDAFTTQPSFWETSLNGTYDASNTTNHFYFDGVIAKCDSPRLGTIPIVSEDMSWDLGDPNPGWPNGQKDVKLVGRYWVILVDPKDSGDWHGNGNLKTASAAIIWWGPNVECAGPGSTTTPFDPNTGLSTKTVKLVNDTN